MSERIIGSGRWNDPLHFQEPWWSGFNDARDRRDYLNGYVTVTARFEYQCGWVAGYRETVQA